MITVMADLPDVAVNMSTPLNTNTVCRHCCIARGQSVTLRERIASTKLTNESGRKVRKFKHSVTSGAFALLFVASIFSVRECQLLMFCYK
jgi:hypothetical protein